LVSSVDGVEDRKEKGRRKGTCIERSEDRHGAKKAYMSIVPTI
jgi:hypothetical protein